MKSLGALYGIFILSAAMRSEARPVYAIETGKPCAYCHENPKGGGPRNKRGLYFAANKHSFKGYDELKVMGRFSPPLLNEGWKESLPASARKVAVGDTVGDGVMRLIVLNDGASPMTRNLAVKKWDGKAWVQEFNQDVPGASDRLGVGRYAGSDKPAVIVTSGSLVYWDGMAYKIEPSPRPVGVLGTVRLKTGAERLLVNEANTVRMARVDTSKGEAWLTGFMDVPSSGETSFSDMKAPSGELQAIGMPDLLANGEVIGLWDARKADAVFFYAIKLVPIVESKGNEPEKNVDQAIKNLVLKGQNYHVTIVDPRSNGFKVLWQSEALEGKVLDVTVNDARTGERGLTVLTESADGKGRTLTFYRLL
jgi:hypothetical protein